MDPQPMGKVRDLGRLAERVACRPTVRWSRLWAFLGFCLLAAVVCGSAVDLPRAQGAGAVAGSLPSARAPTRIPQQITFDQPSDTAVGQPGRLTASSVTATTPAERTGLLVSFRSDTPDLCTVSGATLTPTAAGSCTVASQPGDAQYAPADSMTGSFPVGKIPQTISFTPPRGAETDQRVALSAWATSGLDVSYRTDGPAVCAVSGATVTPATVGTCTITASQPGNDNYAPAQGISRSFPVHRGNVVAVGRIPQVIAFAQPSAAAIGWPVPLAASATSGLVVSFRSDAPSVCTVSGGTVTAIAGGTCTVTASQAGDDRYLAAPDITGSFQVNTGHQAQTITFTLPPQAKVGEAATLTASATSGLMVAFRADTPRICTVSGSTLTPIAAGTCTVTASQGGSDHYAAARDIAQSFDVASATSAFPGHLTMVLGAIVFAVAGATTLVRRARRRSHRPPEPAPTVRAAPVPAPPALVSVQNTGAGVTHTVRIESSPGASVTRIKEGRP